MLSSLSGFFCICQWILKQMSIFFRKSSTLGNHILLYLWWLLWDSSWQSFQSLCDLKWSEGWKFGRLLFAGLLSCVYSGISVSFFYSSDLRTMTERLKSGYFSSKKLFIADMMRIFTNCRTYNAPETEYYKCANTVERFFLSKVKELRKTWRKHQTWKEISTPRSQRYLND